MKRFVTEIFEENMSKVEARALLKNIKEGIVMTALNVLAAGEHKLDGWVIPVRHRSETQRGYMSRLYAWAWKYISHFHIREDYMSSDEYMEHPIYSLIL